MRKISMILLLAWLFATARTHAFEGPPPPPMQMGPAPKPPESTIQWFATLDSAKKEAARTGRPMLIISGTPHCSGVSGIW